MNPQVIRMDSDSGPALLGIPPGGADPGSRLTLRLGSGGSMDQEVEVLDRSSAGSGSGLPYGGAPSLSSSLSRTSTPPSLSRSTSRGTQPSLSRSTSQNESSEQRTGLLESYGHVGRGAKSE